MSITAQEGNSPGSWDPDIIRGGVLKLKANKPRVGSLGTGPAGTKCATARALGSSCQPMGLPYTLQTSSSGHIPGTQLPPWETRHELNSL